MSTFGLEHRFNYHKPTPEKVVAHEAVREQCKTLGLLLDAMLPDGREKATALTNLEHVMFWSNAAIARHIEEETQ
nr:hypothetical protein [Rhodococcus sp. (in: high G+C Gram-positive bacteria)]